MGTKNNPGKYDCYARALPDEPLFVLLARDPEASQAVGVWADLRAALIRDKVKPESDYEMIDEARQCAIAMDTWRHENWPRRRYDQVAPQDDHEDLVALRQLVDKLKQDNRLLLQHVPDLLCRKCQTVYLVNAQAMLIRTCIACDVVLEPSSPTIRALEEKVYRLESQLGAAPPQAERRFTETAEVWEYRQCKFAAAGVGYCTAPLEALNGLGREGWELVGKIDGYYTFKRRVRR